MLIDARMYELKSSTVIKRTLFISLAVHLLLGGVFLVLPERQVQSPAPAQQKQFIKIVPARPPAPATPKRASAPPAARPAEKKVVPKPKPAAKQIPSTKPVPKEEPTALEESTTGAEGQAAGNTASSAAQTTGTGTDGRAAAAQGAAVDLGNIRARFISALQKNKEYPYMARKRNQTGTVSLSISLDAAGNLIDVRVAESSGFQQLDKAGEALVRKACPFKHEAGESIAMNVSVNYNLED